MTHLCKSTNNTESSVSDIGRPITLCLKLCTREPQAHLQETRHGQGCQAWLCYPSPSIMTYCNGMFWVSDPSTESHDGRFHRTVVFCLPTRPVINLFQVRTEMSDQHLLLWQDSGSMRPQAFLMSRSFGIPKCSSWERICGLQLFQLLPTVVIPV